MGLVFFLYFDNISSFEYFIGIYKKSNCSREENELQPKILIPSELQNYLIMQFLDQQ